MYSVYPGLPWAYTPRAGRPSQPGLGTLLKARGSRTAFLSAADPEHDALLYVAQDAGLIDVFVPAELGGLMASSWGTEDGVVVDGLMKWIDADRSRPFFALVWTDQTHHPYTLSADTVPVDFVGNSDAPHAAALNRYLNAMRQVDRHLGRLFDFLRARGLAEDTLVVVTGDHGEAFGDPHDVVVGHGGGVYDENLRVPWLIWNPRLFPAGERRQHAGGQVDLNPTIAHLLGVAPPPDWQGASLFSPDHPRRAYLLADRGGYQFAMTDGRYKYALHETDGFERLYDLRQDPQEQTDVAAKFPEVAREMRRRTSAFVQAEERFLNAKR
jgi:arylsulfatase A-like enzyme